MAGTAQVQSLVAGNTTFALNLYSELATNSGDLFFSPYSISTCLAMLYAGASGNTQQQMSQVLGFGANQQQFATLFGQLQAELATDQQANAIALDIANALWTQEGFPFLPAFLETATNQYQASVNQTDFTTPADDVAATQTINDWVAQQTQNKIQNILPPGSINPLTRLVLANAIYFQGSWTWSFEATNTSTQPFYLSSGAYVEAPLMHQPSPTNQFGVSPADTPMFNYMEINDFQALELPYASNQVSMLLLLPSQVDGLGQMEQELSPALLSNVLAQMTLAHVDIFLPRFTLESSFELSNTLAAMGMPDAFMPGVADFSGIDGQTDLSLTHVFHKAWGEVNEQGTKAAGATVGTVGTSGVMRSSVFVFRADHPFLFFIRDTQTGSLLFLGRLANPTSSAGSALAPALTITPSANGLKISWPAALTGLTLQQSPDFTNWTASAGVSQDATNSFITITASQSRSLFFRLSPQ